MTAPSHWTVLSPPRLGATEARCRRLLHQHRAPVAINLGGHSLTLELAAPRDVPLAGAPAFKVGVSVGGNAGQLGLPSALARLLFDSLDSHLALDHPDGDLVLETILGPALEALEALIGRAIALTPAGQPLPPDLVLIGIRVRRAGINLGLAVLRLSSSDAVLLAEILGPVAPTPALPSQLRLGISVEAGSVMLAPATLAGLGRGDILLADETPGNDLVRLVIAGQNSILARRVKTGLELVTALGGPQQEATTMDQAPPSPTEADGDNTRLRADSLNALKLQVVFEIARLDLPLGQIQAMRPGYVLELDRPATLAVDLVVRGQVIGKAELVQVDNMLGARVVRLFEHD